MADGSHVRTRLGPGEYAIDPPGVWHTANIEGEAMGLIITAGVMNRPTALTRLSS